MHSVQARQRYRGAACGKMPNQCMFGQTVRMAAQRSSGIIRRGHRWRRLEGFG